MIGEIQARDSDTNRHPVKGDWMPNASGMTNFWKFPRVSAGINNYSQERADRITGAQNIVANRKLIMSSIDRRDLHTRKRQVRYDEQMPRQCA